jgi:Type II secretion system (T2SS), protein F
MIVAEALVAALSFAAVVTWPRRGNVVDRLVLRSAASGSPGERDHRPPLRGLAPDLVMDLVACGLRAGLPVGDALACAARAAGGSGEGGGPGSAGHHGPLGAVYLNGVVGRLRLGVPARDAWGTAPPEYAGLARAMVLAELSGAPAASVVVRAAADLRAARREQAELAAARLGVRLVLPLGLAILPGFVLLAVVPIILGLATSLLEGT